MPLGYYRLRDNLLKAAMVPDTTDPSTPNTRAHPPDDFGDIVPDNMVGPTQNMYGNTEEALQETRTMPSDIDQVPVVAKISSIRRAVKERYDR